MAWQGIDVRGTGDRLVFRALLLDATGAIVTTGTTNLKLYEVQSDGTLFSYDWNDNTFKSTALTTENQTMTHRTGNNGGTNTGLWTYSLTTVTDFVEGGIYLMYVSNTNAGPPQQCREFQYGAAQGDLTVTSGLLNVNTEAVDASTAAATSLAALPTEVTKLTTGFSASSPDNLISHLRAMMSKAATTPSGVGTYTAASDSLESQSELLVLMAGSGFSTSTDSLQAIRDAIDTLVAPSIVTSTSLSGSGLISDCIGLIRRAVDEPATNPKYTNTDLLEFLQAAFDVVIADLSINTDSPMLVRYSLPIVSGQQTYTLPPTMQQIWRVAKINSSTGLPEWEVWPGSEFSFTGRGFQVEGQTLRLISDWKQSETLEILFVPNSEVFMHKATVNDAATDITATTLIFPSTVTDGTLDNRPNAYAGYVLRILSSTQNIIEERPIVSYDVSTRTATISHAWDTTPTGTVVYEVVPQFSRLIKHTVCLRAALDVLAQEGNQKRMTTLSSSYAVKMSALRRHIASKVARFQSYANGDTVDNTARGFYGGEVF